MVVTKKLLSSFERTRDVHVDRLDYLLNLWIHPEFAEKCALMFEEIWATTKEIIWQEENILAINDEIYKLDLKRQRLQRKAVVDYSRDKKAS